MSKKKCTLYHFFFPKVFSLYGILPRESLEIQTKTLLSPSGNHFWTQFPPRKTDKFIMQSQVSFKEILMEKMEQDFSENTDFSPKSLDADPLHLAFLLGKINRLHTGPSLKVTKKAYPQSAPKPRPAHPMNESQAESFAFFKRVIADIPEGFTIAELKRAFRAAAKKVHPDHGGSSEQFFALKNHYQNLLGILSSVHS